MSAGRSQEAAAEPPAPPRYRGPAQRFLSRSFGLAPGRHSDPAGVRGYPVDFSAKATRSSPWEGYAAEPGRWLWVGLVQWALGAYERWLAGEGEEWLAG